MKNLLALLLLLLAVSCEIEYDGETRLVLEAIVKDTEGNPLDNKAVEVIVSDLNNSDNISNGNTNQDGHLLLVFPAAKSDSASYNIRIIGSETHQEMQFSNINKHDFVDYKLTLQDVVLYRHDQVTTLRIEIDESNTNLRFNTYTIEAETPNYHVDFGTPFPENYYYDATFNVLKNQTVLLRYSLTDMSTMVTTDYTVEVPVENDPVTYVITY